MNLLNTFLGWSHHYFRKYIKSEGKCLRNHNSDVKIRAALALWKYTWDMAKMSPYIHMTVKPKVNTDSCVQKYEKHKEKP